MSLRSPEASVWLLAMMGRPLLFEVRGECLGSVGFMHRSGTPISIKMIRKMVPKKLIVDQFLVSWGYRATSRKHAYTCTDCTLGTSGPSFFASHTIPTATSTKTMHNYC